MRFNTPISASTKHPKTLTYPSIASSKPVVVQQNGTTKVAPRPTNDGEKTKVRIANPKFRQFNVEATDEYSASVSKLSQYWKDPTKCKKKFLEVPKGKTVLEKSSKFEIQDTVQKKESVVPKGAVADVLKQWQQKDGCDDKTPPEEGSKVNTPELLLESKEKDEKSSSRSTVVETSPDSSIATESPVATSPTTQEWHGETQSPYKAKYLPDELMPADEKNGLLQHQETSSDGTSVSSPVRPFPEMEIITEDLLIPDISDDDIHLHLGQSSSTDANTASTTLETEIISDIGSKDDSFPPAFVDIKSIPEEQDGAVEEEELTNPPSDNGDGGEDSPRDQQHQEVDTGNDEQPPKSSSTRKIAEKFGKVHGTEPKEKLTEVQLRTQKIELMEKEHSRRSDKFGLLKPSWKRAHPAKGLPSTAWRRTFQGNVPPKKTFAELP